MNVRSKLTDDQRKQLEPILDQLERVFDELTNKSREMGVQLDGSCLRCDCESFLRADHGGDVCARSTCRHSLGVHVLWDGAV